MTSISESDMLLNSCLKRTQPYVKTIILHVQRAITPNVGKPESQ